jgi:hypothetical protein
LPFIANQMGFLAFSFHVFFFLFSFLFFLSLFKKKEKEEKKKKKWGGRGVLQLATNLIVRVLLGLEPLGSKTGDVGPEALVKGGLELDIDAVFECRPVMPAVRGHCALGARGCGRGSGRCYSSRTVSCDQPVESNLSDGGVRSTGVAGQRGEAASRPPPLEIRRGEVD